MFIQVGIIAFFPAGATNKILWEDSALDGLLWEDGDYILWEA